MDSSLTNDLNLNEYIEVFVNVDQTWKTKDAAKSPDIEEQKLWLMKKNHISNKDKTKFEAIIYSIKEVTDNKTEEQILQLIKDELNIVDSDIKIWNRMIDSISQMKIDDHYKLEGIFPLILFERELRLM